MSACSIGCSNKMRGLVCKWYACACEVIQHPRCDTPAMLTQMVYNDAIARRSVVYTTGTSLTEEHKRCMSSLMPH